LGAKEHPVKISAFLNQATVSRYPKGNLDRWPAAVDFPIVHAIPYDTKDLATAKKELEAMNHAAKVKNLFPYSLLLVRTPPKKLFHWRLKAIIPANPSGYWIINSDDAVEMVKRKVGKPVN